MQACLQGCFLNDCSCSAAEDGLTEKEQLQLRAAQLEEHCRVLEQLLEVRIMVQAGMAGCDRYLLCWSSLYIALLLTSFAICNSTTF